MVLRALQMNGFPVQANGRCYARFLPTESKNQKSVPFDFHVIAHSICPYNCYHQKCFLDH